MCTNKLFRADIIFKRADISYLLKPFILQKVHMDLWYFAATVFPQRAACS